MSRLVLRHLTRCASQLANYFGPDKLRETSTLVSYETHFYNMVCILSSACTQTAVRDTLP